MVTHPQTDQGRQTGHGAPPASGGAGASAAQHAQQRTASGWCLDAATVRATEPSTPLLANIAPESLRVHLPRQLEGHTMAAFEARAVQRFVWEGPAAAEHAAPAPGTTPGRRGRQTSQQQQQQQQSRDRETVVDGLIYTGGPVWTLDWAPWPQRSGATGSSGSSGGSTCPGPVDACELLVLSTHPKGMQRTRLGALHRGPGALQLWAVPHSGPAAAPTAAAGAGPGSSSGSGGSGSSAALPRCLALLPHNGRLAWDLRWCPEPSAFLAGGMAAIADGTLSAPTTSTAASSSSGALQVAGVLAAVLGDGSVKIYAVPALHHLAALAAEYRQQQQRRGNAGTAAAAAGSSAADGVEDGSSGKEQASEEAEAAAVAAAAAGVPSLDLAPMASLSPDEMGGSPASCCAWCPVRPHDVLLVGCWDGHVAAWRLPTARGDGDGTPRLLLRLLAERCPIRCIAWQPDSGSSRKTNGSDYHEWEAAAAAEGEEPAATAAAAAEEATGGGSDSSSAPGGGRCFLTASHLGDLRFWDPVDLSAPLHSRNFTRAAATAIAWARDPGAVVGLFADGGVRVMFTTVVGIAGLMRGKSSRAMFLDGPDPSPMWAISFHPTQRVAAYCGDSGVLGLLPIEPPLISRRHVKPAAVLSAIAIGAGGDAWLLTAADIPPGAGGLYPGGVSVRKDEPAADSGRRGFLHNPLQALHAAAFSPNVAAGAGGAVWVAAGGAAGLVRVHRVMVVVEGGDDTDAIVE